ncbi:MAG: hypothetical protein HY957_01980 [Nitrospirae bacterium]|nr:hypothetical protein [Nitrospirota bacterium]
MRKIFLIGFLLCFFIVFVCVPFVGAEQTEKAKDTSSHKQKAVPHKKNPLLKIKQGDVYPGDAALAGYEETSTVGLHDTRIYKIEDKKMRRTYIFSEVEASHTGDSYGYFRVLERYGYGKKEENERDHLIFAMKTPPPACENPIKAACGNPMRKIGSKILLFYDRGRLGIYWDELMSGTLREFDGNVPIQNIADIDGDGNFEIKAFTYIKNPAKSFSTFEVFGIYSYLYSKDCGCSKFARLKGKPFEKIYIEHAKKIKKSNLVDWLAAIESTENPDLIKQALDEFWKLSFPDDKEKQRILELLIDNGSVGLKLK